MNFFFFQGQTSQSKVYATTEITNNAIAWIASQQSANKQYFAWVAYHAPHEPLHAPPSSLHARTLADTVPRRGAAARPFYWAMIEAMVYFVHIYCYFSFFFHIN